MSMKTSIYAPKPREPGTNCPLWKKDVSKVCHTCEFYKVMRGKKAVKDSEADAGEWIEQWACTIAHQHMMLAGVAAHTNEQTTELNVLRNQMAQQNAQESMLMARVGQVIEMLMQQVAIGNRQREQVLEQQPHQFPVINGVSQ